MDLLTVGNTVTIKVRSPLADARDRYASGVIREFNTYTGTVIREKWFDHDEIGLTNDDSSFPKFRRIQRHRIVEVNAKAVDYSKPVQSDKVTVVVQGSKGNSYIVTKENGKASCTCAGFQFRKTCKHSQEVLTS